jgi:hypothetical protein
MKRLVLLAMLIGVVTMLGQPGICLSRWCPDIRCYGSAACGVCVCVSRDYSGGVCIDIEAVPLMLQQGYQKLR